MIRYNEVLYLKIIEKEAKLYIKTALTKVRKITPPLIKQYNGILETREGRAKMKLGDYLATEGDNYWIISRISFQNNKQVVKLRGKWSLVKSTKNIKALAMTDAFEVKVAGFIQKGKEGDYLACNGFSFWIVDKNIFEKEYQLLCHNEKV